MRLLVSLSCSTQCDTVGVLCSEDHSPTPLTLTKKKVEWDDVCFLLHLCPSSCPASHPPTPSNVGFGITLAECIARLAWPAHRDNNYPSVCALFTRFSKCLSSCNSLRREKNPRMPLPLEIEWLWVGRQGALKGLYGYVWGLVGKHCFRSRSTSVRNCHWQEDIK